MVLNILRLGTENLRKAMTKIKQETSRKTAMPASPVKRLVM